jgi:hypothetical protein
MNWWLFLPIVVNYQQAFTDPTLLLFVISVKVGSLLSWKYFVTVFFNYFALSAVDMEIKTRGLGSH